MPIRVVIADDHPIVLRGLVALLESEPDFQVVGRATDGELALGQVRAHDPDILLLDLHMPGMDGLQVLKHLKREGLRARAVLLVADLDDDELLEATRHGVAGVLLKEMPPRLLLQCLRKVGAGERWVEQGSAARAFERMRRREASVRDLARLLTPSEIEIVEMVARGLRIRTIAEHLSLGEAAVKTHLHSAFEKLGVSSRAELVAYCHERGIA